MTNNPDTQPMVTEEEGPFHVSRSSDGTKHWFSARDPVACVTIPGKSRADAYALVGSLNRAFAVHLTRTQQTARSADGGREALRRADELIRSIQQTPGGQWVVVSDDDEKLVCETDAFVSKALAAFTPPTDEPLQDGGLREALGEEISRKIARVHSSHHDSAIPVTIKISRTYREMEALVQALSRGKP